MNRRAKWLFFICIVCLPSLGYGKAKPTTAANEKPDAGARSVGRRLAADECRFPCPEWIDDGHVLLRHALIRRHDEGLDEAWIYDVQTGNVIKVRGEAGATLTLSWGFLRFASDNTEVGGSLACDVYMAIDPGGDTVPLNKATLDPYTHRLYGVRMDPGGSRVVLWNMITGRFISFRPPTAPGAGSCEFAQPSPVSRDGKRVAFCMETPGADYCDIFVYDSSTLKLLWRGFSKEHDVQGRSLFWTAHGLLMPPETGKRADGSAAPWRSLDPVSLKVSDMEIPGRIESVPLKGDWVEVWSSDKGVSLINLRTHASIELGFKAGQVGWSPQGDRVVWVVRLDIDDENSPTDVYWLDLSAYEAPAPS
jgi:hypothetical protein